MLKAMPGPWRVGDTVRDPFYITSDNGIVALAIAGYAVGSEGALANARLIAAAPDLLELLKRLADDYPPSSIGREWIDAAIARAESR